MSVKCPVIYAAIIIASAVLSSAASLQNATIKGFISPGNGALAVWATSPDETLRVDVTNGNFELNGVKEGTYSIRVQAIAPYACVTKEGIKVEDGVQINLGEIKLEKQRGLLGMSMAHGR